MMTPASTFSITAAAIGLVITVLSLGFASAPGWKELRWFAGISFTAGLFCAGDSVATMGLSPRVVVAASQFTLLVAGVHGFSWLGYMAAQQGRPMTRLERSAGVLLVTINVLALVPGLLVSPVLGRHTWGGMIYDDASPTTLGTVAYLGFYGSLFIPMRVYLRAWRRGVPASAPHALALIGLFVMALNDGLVATGVVSMPYLLDAAFLGIIVAVGTAVTRRFVANARSLDMLSNRLERAVEERTRELADAQEALLRAENLAALGQLAAGVAHEINNPTAAIMANLAYLEQGLVEEGALPVDGRDCIKESLASTRRIASIVRQLLDAGRIAGGRISSGLPVDVSRTIHATLATARPSIPAHVQVTFDVPEGLFVRGDAQHIEQILVNLVINAAQAIPADRPGHVVLRASSHGDRVRLEVQDDGVGIPEATQHQIFEPFYTTKAFGHGTGLGLAVSLGLARTLGGDLVLAESGSHGTCMRLDLRHCPAPSTPPLSVSLNPPSSSALPAYKPRLLLVDDDAPVREALRRSLAAYFVVEAVGGVAQALAAVTEAEAFDAVLCDVMMPDGGGARFLDELRKLRPRLAQHTLFVTGGATTAPVARALGVESRRILRKPIDLGAICGLIDEVCNERTSLA